MLMERAMGTNHRKTAIRLLFVSALLCNAAATPAQTADEPAVFVSGTFDLLLSVADSEALDANRMRRADSPLSHLRMSLFGDVVVSDRLTLFNQLPIDPSSRAPLGTFLRSYIRYRLFASEESDLHVEAGKIPTPFGHFTERSYTDKNPLLGFPLMYHYPTSLRSNQLPASNADLLSHRGQGRPSGFGGYGGGGARVPNTGLPLVYDSCWDFGGALLGSYWRFEYLVAVTSGTLSDPRPSGTDNNDGRQIAVRLGFVPFTGLHVRGSFARGPYLDQAVGDTLRATGRDVEDYHQQIAGLSVEYGVRHFQLNAEVAANSWESPNIRDGRNRSQDLEVFGYYVEGKYNLRPGLHAAVRYGGLRFGDIDDGGRSLPWDYDVNRLEFGLGYRPTEHLITKLAAQLNDFGRPGDVGERILASQLTVLF